MSRERDRRQRRRSGPGNGRRHEENSQRESRESRDTRERRGRFRSHSAVSHSQIQSEDEAIKNFKTSNQPVCPVCSKIISDLSSALMQRGGGSPIHFECAMEQVASEEKLGEGEKIAYIGQGRFGVLSYPNIRDVRHFSIKKIIDWEDRNTRGEWRNEMADLYSQIK